MLYIGYIFHMRAYILDIIHNVLLHVLWNKISCFETKQEDVNISCWALYPHVHKSCLQSKTIAWHCCRAENGLVRSNLWKEIIAHTMAWNCIFSEINKSLSFKDISIGFVISSDCEYIQQSFHLSVWLGYISA